MMVLFWFCLIFLLFILIMITVACDSWNSKYSWEINLGDTFGGYMYQLNLKINNYFKNFWK